MGSLIYLKIIVIEKVNLVGALNINVLSEEKIKRLEIEIIKLKQ